MEITYGYYSRRYDLSKSRNREYERMLDIADSQNGNVPAGTDIFTFMSVVIINPLLINAILFVEIKKVL